MESAGHDYVAVSEMIITVINERSPSGKNRIILGPGSLLDFGRTNSFYKN